MRVQSEAVKGFFLFRVAHPAGRAMLILAHRFGSLDLRRDGVQVGFIGPHIGEKEHHGQYAHKPLQAKVQHQMLAAGEQAGKAVPDGKKGQPGDLSRQQPMNSGGEKEIQDCAGHKNQRTYHQFRLCFQNGSSSSCSSSSSKASRSESRYAFFSKFQVLTRSDSYSVNGNMRSVPS